MPHSRPYDAPICQGLRVDSDGILAEDAFCPQCGYNLRGLPGDPIRCPECGEASSLEGLAVPAPLIRAALRGMEHAPTRCVAGSVGLAVMLPLFAWGGSEGRVVAMLGMIVFGVLWAVGYQGACSAFRKDEFRRWILIEFHVIALIFVVPFGLSPVFQLAGFWERFGPELVIVIPASMAICWPVAFYRYGRARRRLAEAKRVAAVVIARDAQRLKLSNLHE